MLIDTNGSIVTDDSATTPAPEPGCAVSGTPASGIAQRWAETTRELIAQPDFPAERIRFFHQIVAFGVRTNSYLVDAEIDLWGYGTARILFAQEDGGWWMPLHNLVEPTGLPFAQLVTMYCQDVEDDYSDVEELSWVTYDEDENRELFRLELVKHSFAMRAMLAGPWAGEFAEAMFPSFRLALVASGLADRLGPVIRQNTDGSYEQTDMTFGEFMAQGEPLPTHEQAREQAFLGPAGAL